MRDYRAENHEVNNDPTPEAPKFVPRDPGYRAALRTYVSRDEAEGELRGAGWMVSNPREDSRQVRGVHRLRLPGHDAADFLIEVSFDWAEDVEGRGPAYVVQTPSRYDIRRGLVMVSGSPPTPAEALALSVDRRDAESAGETTPGVKMYDLLEPV